MRQEAHRKIIPGGQRIVFARLHLRTYEAVLGVPAADIAGRIARRASFSPELQAAG